jgi:hypothetical protein
MTFSWGELSSRIYTGISIGILGFFQKVYVIPQNADVFSATSYYSCKHNRQDLANSDELFTIVQLCGF